ncbi:hypothetical protein ABMA10_18875 [Plantibacter sp. RU18]
MDDWHRRIPALVVEIDAALADERWDAVGSLLDDYFFALSISAPDVIDRVWQHLPDEWLQTHPRYVMAAAVTEASTKPFQLIAAPADRTFAEWVDGQESPATRDVMGARLALVRRHMASGRIERATAIADEIQELLREAPDHEGFEDVLPSVFIRLGMVRLLSGALGRAISSFAESWRWSQATYPHPFAPFAAAHCALAYALAGDYVHAQMWRDRSMDMPTAVPNTMAYSFHAAGELADVLLAIGAADAEAAQRKARELDHGIERGELWWVAVHARSRIALYWGDRSQVSREISAELHAYPSLTGPSSLAGIVLRCDLADLYQADLDFDAAQHLLDQLDQGSPCLPAVSTMTRQLMLRGNLDAAERLLIAAARPPLLSAHPPARWEVLRANIIAADSARDQETVLRVAAQRVQHTGAYDAMFDADSAVRAAISAVLESPASAVRPDVDLTRRETEIVGLLAEGLPVRQIAEELFISPNTMKSHLGRIYRKLGVQNRTEAVAAASCVTGSAPEIAAG